MKKQFKNYGVRQAPVGGDANREGLNVVGGDANHRLCAGGIKALLVAALFLSICFNVNAQTVVATLRADSSQILIGDHLKIRLAVKYPKTLKVPMPPVADTLGNMDVISTNPKLDTIYQNDEMVVARGYVVSAFDSGHFHAGPIAVIYPNGTGGFDTILSNDIPVLVNTVPVDTTKAFKPIKAPLEVPFSWKEFIPYIIAAYVILFLLLGGFYLWYRYRKNKPKVAERPKPKDPAHIWARKELKKLEEEKLWQKDQVKLYYSRLTDILRMYLEYRFDWLALESTTEEIELKINDYNIKDKAKDFLLPILRTADFVKFAKMLPGPDVNIQAMENANKFIDWTEPKEEADIKNLKKEKNV